MSHDVRIVIALGGNALGNTPEEQQKKVDEACPSLINLIAQGNEIIVCHGNGPQVGMISLAFDEATPNNPKICRMGLPECTAMSQGYIGYHLQKGMGKELRKQKMPWQVATVVTQVIVDKNDPAFSKPTKPICAFYTKEKVDEMKAADPALQFVEDSGRGYRRVVASPKPVEIAEAKSILNLLDNEYIVIACGGGGIPVIVNESGNYEGVPAVIDKDFAAAKLAEAVDAHYLFILTAVDYVSINFGKPNQKELKTMTVAEARQYIKDGQFAAGSMLPKVQAAINFVNSGDDRKAIIASLEKAPLAIRGESGTTITR
jgi:carbamate kinase